VSTIIVGQNYTYSQKDMLYEVEMAIRGATLNGVIREALSRGLTLASDPKIVSEYDTTYEYDPEVDDEPFDPFTLHTITAEVLATEWSPAHA
jgi:hypothetical protein